MPEIRLDYATQILNRNKNYREFYYPGPGWDATCVDSGNRAERMAGNFLQTGVNANSSAMVEAEMLGHQPGGEWADHNFDKEHLIIAHIIRTWDDAEVDAFLQYKANNALGALTVKGYDISMVNYALWGVGYGTARSGVNLGITMASSQVYEVWIHHRPDLPQIDYYVDRVLANSITIAANIPTGMAGASCYYVAAIKNGATGGVDAYFVYAQLREYVEV